jgi:hypothetical protein
MSELFEFIYEDEIKEVDNKYVMTITFGDCAENHVGMQQLGELRTKGEGMDYKYLQTIKETYEKLGFKCEIVDLVKEGDVKESNPADAYVLIIREGYKAMLGDDANIEDLNAEMLRCEWDTKAYMRGRVVNKKARYNLIFSNDEQEPDYENKKGRIIKYDDVPLLKKIHNDLPVYFGEKADKLHAEGNYYYDMKNTYIGFHGDAERRIVVAMRLGNVIMPFHYQWFLNSNPIGERIIVDLNPGDMYVMSEKAVGTDWMTKRIPTLRHATSMNPKFLEIKLK